MEDPGVQPWRAGKIESFGAETQTFAQDNILQTFADNKEILQKVGGLEQFKGEKKRKKVGLL